MLEWKSLDLWVCVAYLQSEQAGRVLQCQLKMWHHGFVN